MSTMALSSTVQYWTDTPGFADGVQCTPLSPHYVRTYAHSIALPRPCPPAPLATSRGHAARPPLSALSLLSTRAWEHPPPPSPRPSPAMHLHIPTWSHTWCAALSCGDALTCARIHLLATSPVRTCVRRCKSVLTNSDALADNVSASIPVLASTALGAGQGQRTDGRGLHGGKCMHVYQRVECGFGCVMAMWSST